LNRLSHGFPDGTLNMSVAAVWESATQTLPSSLRSKEAASPMPISKDDVQIHERVAKLEAKIEAYPDSMVTWKQLFISVFGSFIGTVAVVASLSYSLWSHVSRKFESYDTDVAAIKTDVAAIKQSLNNKATNSNPLLTPGTITATLKGLASINPADLVTELPNVRTMLAIAREKKIAISDQDYKQISTPLFQRLAKADNELKNQLWPTIVDLTTTKSSTYTAFHPLSAEEINKAKSEQGHFWENQTVDLSANAEWRNTIFKNCKITISNPDKTITLKQVKFVESDFQSIPQTKLSQGFFAIVLKTVGPTVTKVIDPSYVTVDYHRGHISLNNSQSTLHQNQSQLATTPARTRLTSKRYH